MLKHAINKLAQQENLTEHEMFAAVTAIMEGAATNAQIGAFLASLRIKGETAEEVTGGARAMLAKADTVRPEASYTVDTCGTGGDGAGTFNISTAAAFVASAAGVKVAKHGNRAMSGKCGSADVLESLGVNIALSPGGVKSCIDGVGIGFMFAPGFHKAMKYVAGPRKELGIRTVFNLIGPLCNPSGVKGQVLGVYDGKLTRIVAEVLHNLGVERALVVHGTDGTDEISLNAPTKVSELRGGEVKDYFIDPGRFGLRQSDREALAGGDADCNARILRAVLAGEKGPKRDVTLLNAAAAIYVGKLSDSMEEGMELAQRVLDSGMALEKLESLISCSRGLS